LFGHNESVVTDEGVAGGSHSFLAVGGEGNVGSACVAAIERPFGLAVADNEATRCGHGEREYNGGDEDESEEARNRSSHVQERCRSRLMMREPELERHHC
jgi:hypothetical protein